MVLWRLTLCFTLFTLLSSVLSVKVDDLYGDENTGENKPNFVGDWGFTTGLSGPNGIDCTNCDSTYRGHPSEYGKPYKGTWHSSLNKDPVHTPYVELNFEGTSVTVYGVFSQKNEVQVKIVVDGKPFPDFVYDPPMNQVDYEVTVVVFEKKDLSPGSHTIVLSNLDGVMFSFDSDEHSPSPQSPPENTPAGNGNSTQSPDNGTGSSHNGPTQSPDNGTGSSNNNSTQSPDNGTGISNSGPTQSSDHGTGSPSSTSNISSVTSSLLSQNVSTTSTSAVPTTTLTSDSAKTSRSETVLLTGATVAATTISIPTQVATTSSSAARSTTRSNVPVIVGGTIAGVIGLAILLLCLLMLVRRRMALRRREEQAEAQAQAATPFTSERPRAFLPLTLSTPRTGLSRGRKGTPVPPFQNRGQGSPPLYSEA